MVQASEVKRVALSLVGERYKLGEEAFGYVVGTQQTTDPNDTDCSGSIYSTFRKAGVTVNGKALPRLTAHDYWRMTTPLTYPGPFRCGDVAFQIRDGRAYHVAMVIDAATGLMIEAGNHGPNNTMPGSGYIGTLTIAQMNARGGVKWGHWQTNIEEDDMDEATVNKLIDARLESLHATDEIKAAEAHLMRLGLLQKGRAPQRIPTWGLFVTMLSRVLKLLGRP
ncbi:MAG: hypothetical protein WC233_07530 [Sphaerochaeta sp.]